MAADDDLAALAYVRMDLVGKVDLEALVDSAMDTLVNDAVALDRIEL